MFLNGDILLKSQIQNYNIDENIISEKTETDNNSVIQDDEGAYKYIPGDTKPHLISQQSAKNIVDTAIQQGYSAEEATVVYRAQKAYDANNNSTFKYNSNKSSSYRSYTISD